MSTAFNELAVLFTDRDVGCMSGMGVDLKSYAYMSDPAGDEVHPDHANAGHVLARIKGDETPRMPLGVAPWTPAMIGVLESWIADGYQP